ncbi:MAG TPA: S41 family peptidase, partial [Flavobacteriaceae bacterium]|nr:S41 family peptidase [Flavobacteriaceae bacterium]
MKTKVKKKLAVLTAIVAIGISTAFQSDFFEIAKQIDIYTTLFKELNMYYVDEVNPAKLTNTAINNMLESLDPYTKYYDEQGVEDVKIISTGEYGGIGVISANKKEYLLVKEIFKNSPAERAGIKAGDQIIKVGDVLVKHFEGENISMLVNGLPGTKVNLTVNRNNKNLTFNVERAKITINPVPYFTMINNEVGYIAFIRFNEKAGYEVKKAYDQLKAEGMQKLIIDVRGNPGGLLHEAVNITNYFIPKDKVVVTTKAKIEKWSDTYKTSNEPLDLTIPIVILIDGKSASASEILAGALQDYDRGVVVGERSFGKGLVQRYRELSYGTQMKLTISKYYTPSGRCIQELDYTNRDKKGNVPKFSDSGRETYTTAKGRKVYGGGGILPDVTLNKPKTTKTTEILLQSDAFFNYITNYYNKNPNI